MPAGSLSPMMQQYREAREAAGDALLLFRMGDFYELFFDDAKTAARTLGLALTSRDKGDDPVPMAGFPHHQLDSYLAKIIAAGHRAAICEQVENPKQAKGLVKREVTRIVTPGTLTDDALLDPRTNNFLAAVVCATDAKSAPVRTGRLSDQSIPGLSMEHAAGIAWVDISTGRFYAATFPTGQIADQLVRIQPAELLVSDDLPPLAAEWTNGISITRRPAWAFGRTTAIETLTKHFGTRTLEGFGFDAEPARDRFARAAGRGRRVELSDGDPKGVARTHQPTPPVLVERTIGDRPATRRSLELVATLREGKREGSLLGVLDRTVTSLVRGYWPIGSRHRLPMSPPSTPESMQSMSWSPTPRSPTNCAKRYGKFTISSGCSRA